jgi:hypothetical protein
VDALRWYRVRDPAEDHYLYRRPVPITRPIFQGDVFDGVPSVYVRHPSDVAAERRPSGTDQAPLIDPIDVDEGQLRDTARIRRGMAILIPHICNYYETQKGKRGRIRVVAAVRKRANERIPDDWAGAYNLFPLPNLLGDGD